jgi:hypothetical protein
VLGDAVFERFSAPEPTKASVLWYYHALYDVYVDSASARDPRRERLTEPLADALAWLNAKTPTQQVG